MARPMEKGCRYFPLDVDFYVDPKLKRLRSVCGRKAESVIIRLWCKIYEDNGYYLPFGEYELLELADELGDDFSVSYIGEVVARCCQHGIFNDAVYKAVGVLTSAAIQKRYLAIKTKQKVIPIYSDYWVCKPSDFGGDFDKLLLKLQFFGINGEETAVNAEKTGVNTEETQQKKSKGNENKGKKSKPSPGGDPIAVFADGDDVLEAAVRDFIENRKQRKKPMTPLAITKMLGKLQSLATAAGVRDKHRYMMECMDCSIRRDWSDVFAYQDFVDTPATETVKGSGKDEPRDIAADADLAALFGGD